MGRRHANVDWNLPETDKGVLQSWDHVTRALLMDIRDELRTLNNTLACYRVARMSDDIHRIDRRLRESMPLKRGRTSS